MGHKGVSKRKLPQVKSKPLQTSNHSGGAVSDLSQHGNGTARQSAGQDNQNQVGKGGSNSSSGSRKKNKNR
jgi:hypothetical protein